MRRPPVVLGMAFITALALCVAIALILFQVNPGTRHNQRDIKNAQAEIQAAQRSEHALTCAFVQLFANTYRFRSLTPGGEIEPIRHFLTRIESQAEALRLSKGLDCKSAPGFPPVGLQVRRALRQIHEILQHFEPKLREPVSHGISDVPRGSSDKRGGFLRDVPRPSKAGIDETGVPAHLKHELAPSAPATPRTEREHTAPPPEGPQTVEPPKEEPTQAEGPGTNVSEPKRPELPSTPIQIEVKTPILETEIP